LGWLAKKVNLGALLVCVA